MSRFDLSMEQRVVRELKQLASPPRRVLLAISGGVDSVVMGEILWKWKGAFRLQLAVAHVHHGNSASAEQLRYRSAAREMVQDWANQKGLEFFTNKISKRVLKSEGELREFRHRCLRRWCMAGGFDAVAFAHHRDDLLETRLIRLIRGSGQQGLRAMSFASPGILRPLLTLSRAEVEAYATQRGLKWMEDPSNVGSDPLRNWLRREWLPLLEQKRAGSLSALSRSLDILAPRTEPAAAWAEFVGLRREELGKAAPKQREELIASYLHSLGVRDYGRTHIREILKRLSTRRRESEFELLGMNWKITPDLVWASRV